MPENKENILRTLFEFLFFYRAFGFCLLMLLFQVSFYAGFYSVFFLRYFAFLSCIRRNLLPIVRGERTPFYLVYFGNRKGICSFLLRPRNILIFRILFSVRCCSIQLLSTFRTYYFVFLIFLFVLGVFFYQHFSGSDRVSDYFGSTT